MEAFLVLLALALVALLVTAPVLALVAFLRTGRSGQLQRKLDRVEQELGQLRSELERDRAAGRQPAPVSPPAAEPEQVLPVRPEPEAKGPVAPTPPTATGKTEPGPSRYVVQEKVPEPVRSAPKLELKPRLPQVNWERWIGVRGAAVVGGIVFALAGVLFFQHAFNMGWITPEMRVIAGGIVGIACLGISEWLRSKDYRFTPQALAGAGVVVLYASIWASHVLYSFISLPPAFVLMGAVTALCCWLSVRQSSLIVAIFGLVGGFATPLLLSLSPDKPLGLFGYILLLDLGLLAVGHKKRWPLLGLMGLLGTLLFQLRWIGLAMDEGAMPLALILLGVFAVVFSLSGRMAPARDRGRWLASQAGALLVPILFAFYFAQHVDFGKHIWSIALLLGFLSAGCCWIGRAQNAPWLPVGGAAGVVAVVGVWLFRTQLTDESLVWELAAVAIGLSLVFALFSLWHERRAAAPPAFRGSGVGAVAVGTGLLLWTVLAAGRRNQLELWPWLVVLLGLGGLLLLLGRREGRGAFQLLGPLGISIGLANYMNAHAHAGNGGFPGTSPALVVVLGTGALFLLVAFLFNRNRPLVEGSPRWTWHGAAAVCVPLAFTLVDIGLFRAMGAWPFLGAALLLGLMIAVSASALRSGLWLLTAVGVTSGVHVVWISQFLRRNELYEASLPALGLACLGVVLFTLWPLLNASRFRQVPMAWRIAAFAPILWYDSVRELFEVRFDVAIIGILPLLVAVFLFVVLRANARSLRAEAAGEPSGLVPLLASQTKTGRVAVVWFAAVAVLFLAITVPEQIDRSPYTVPPALFALGIALLWKRLDHVGLKGIALAALAVSFFAVTVKSLGLDGSFEKATWPVINWMSYAILLPTLCYFGIARLIHTRELERLRDFERSLYRPPLPYFAGFAGLLGIIGLFFWINLSIFDWFEEGERMRVDFDRMPARDLSMSIAWALYGLALLIFGMARKLSPLRWLSLAFLIGTLAKVFLYDLGELQGLYRVASLLGLAMSLLLVSLLYQRFVFPSKRSADAS